MEDQLNALQQRNDLTLSMGPYQKKLLQEKKLYTAMLQAKSTKDNAPIELEKAQKQYYVYKDGEASYEIKMERVYQKEAVQLNTNMMNKYDKKNKELDTSLPYYSSQRTYMNNINIVQLTLLKNILKKLKTIRTDIALKNTNNRKSYYLTQEQNYIDAWVTFCNYALISFLCIYIYHNQTHGNETVVWIGAICIFIIIALLSPFLKMIQSIPVTINVYTEWGYSPDIPRTPILWSIGVGLLVIYICLWLYDNIDAVEIWIDKVFLYITTLGFLPPIISRTTRQPQYRQTTQPQYRQTTQHQYRQGSYVDL